MPQFVLMMARGFAYARRCFAVCAWARIVWLVLLRSYRATFQLVKWSQPAPGMSFGNRCNK